MVIEDEDLAFPVEALQEDVPEIEIFPEIKPEEKTKGSKKKPTAEEAAAAAAAQLEAAAAAAAKQKQPLGPIAPFPIFRILEESALAVDQLAGFLFLLQPLVIEVLGRLPPVVFFVRGPINAGLRGSAPYPQVKSLNELPNDPLVR